MTGILIPDKYYSDPGKILKGVDLPDPNLIISSECLQIYGNNLNDYCFMYSKDTLESFSFQPNPKLAKIGPYSFYQCTKLSSIDLSPCSQLIIVDTFAFQGCSSVTTLLLPNGLQNISSFAFSSLSISSVVIPSSVTYINQHGFAGSSTLTSITFEEGSKLTTLESNVFMSTSLTKITIPESVTTISGPFFNNILTLKNIYVHPNNHNFAQDGIAIYSPDYTKIYAYPPNASESYEIKSTVIYIAEGAFVTAQFTSVTIPQSVKYIYKYAFQMTTKLKQIILPPNLNEIPTNCFYGSNLTSIEIPSQVTIIRSGAFVNCKYLTKVVLPENIKTIEGGAFPPNINIVLSSSSSLYLDDQMLMIQSDNTSIIMCFNSAATSITIPSKVKTIKSSAFKQKYNLKSIVCDGISELEYLENSVFEGCTSFTTIPSFPKLISIGYRAFYNTKLNSNMVISQNVSYIGPSAFELSTIPGIIISSKAPKLSIYNYAFKNCLSLSSFLFQDCSASVAFNANCFENCRLLSFFNVVSNIKEMGSSCFINSGISHISFENKMTSFNILDTMLFKDCVGLEEIDIPKNILTIGNECFSGTSIRKLTIPDNVEILSSKCFSNCVNLERVEIASTCNLKEILSRVFENCSRLSYISNFVSQSFACVNSTIFDSSFSNVYIHAPACKDNYISFDHRLVTVYEGAFYNCIYVEIVVFVDSSVVTIGRSAFESCTRLKQISIPSSVKSIGENAFRNCSSLRCGVLYQNKSESFKDILISSGISKLALRACEIFSCPIKRSIDFPVSLTLFTVFILL